MSQSRDKVLFRMIRGQQTEFRYDDGLKIYFGLEGFAEIHMEQNCFSLQTGGLMAVRPHVLYRISCMDGAVAELQISSEIQRAAGSAAGLNYKCYVQSDEGLQPEYEELRTLYAELLYAYLQNRHEVSAAAGSPLMRMMQHLQRHFAVKVNERGLQSAADRRAEDLVRYIDAHWDEELSLSSMAQEFHFSISYLSRFFQKTTGMHFSAYLRKLRVIHAYRMLSQGTASVTQIAYDCGFRNPSVLIDSFRQEYQMTPGQMRQKLADEARLQEETASGRDQRGDLSVILEHMPEQKSEQVHVREELIEVRLTAGRNGFCGQDRIMNIGYARDGLLAEVRGQMRRAQEEIGFRYFRCHGILDADMHVYKETTDIRFSFVHVDLLLDYVTELGMLPYLELGFMPPELAERQTRIFDRPSVISGCNDLEKWKQLIWALLQHLADRYGKETIRGWRFTTISLSYVRIGCLTREEFAELYETTYRVVKAFDSQLQFGGAGYFPDLTGNNEIGVPWFLRFAAEHNCLPDFHSMQWYPCVQTDDALFMEYTLNQQSAPALISTDPDYLKRKLDELESLYRAYHADGRELFLEECNATLWQRDLSGDTCYKAVWLAKNMMQSAGRAVFGYWLLTDFLEERAQIPGVFHGGYGLFTYNGIPKAGYHAMRMIAALGTKTVAEGNGWIVTQEDNAIRLLLYNYTHYTDLNCYRYKRLETPSDAYSVFQAGELMRLQFRVSGLASGKYRICRSFLSREHGSSFDRWVRLQAPDNPGREEITYLKERSVPLEQMEMVFCEETLMLDVQLRPLEMELIQIEPVTV